MKDFLIRLTEDELDDLIKCVQVMSYRLRDDFGEGDEGRPQWLHDLEVKLLDYRWGVRK